MKKIRDALVIEHHKVKPIDCKVGVWAPGACSVECDGTCIYDDSDNVCGGVQTLTREVDTQPNEFGVKCPALTNQLFCNQIKCPVNCVLSEWSGWSECTADCAGGLQTHTRSVLTNPKNGGMACDTLEESRPCNTMSCDRVCTLDDDWTDWTPCSMACNGGFQERFKHVEIPKRGYGTCPSAGSNVRYQTQSCNPRQCVDGEVCIAKQDIFVYVDSSAKSKILTKAYQELFDGDNAAFKNSDSVIQGGYWLENGELKLGFPKTEDDGSWDDLYPIGKDVETRLRLDGGYRIARAADAAEAWLSKNGREGAASKFIIIADIKAIDSLFVLRKTLNKMKENGIYVQAIAWHYPVPNEDLLNHWEGFVSEPSETNIVFVPLGSDTGTIRQSVIAKFCPLAESPSA